MTPKVSVVITSYNRAKLLGRTLESIHRQCSTAPDFEVVVVDDGNDSGETESMCDTFRCDAWGLRYFKRNREPGTHYSNPAVPNNIGIRQAQGELIILQNAECVHRGEVIRQFYERTTKDKAVFATVEALTERGNHEQYYIHPVLNPRPFFFCGALHRETFIRLRGFDEDYKFYGFDDNDFSDRLTLEGIKFDFSSIQVSHLYHGPSWKPEDAQRNFLNQHLYKRKSEDLAAGRIGVVRNLDREWGQL